MRSPWLAMCAAIFKLSELYWFWRSELGLLISPQHPVSYLRVIITAMVNGFLMPNVWTAVLIGLNRYLTVCHPVRARRLCTMDNARRQFVGIVCCSIVYMIPKFLEYKLVTTDDGVYSEPQLAKSKWFIYIYTVGCEAMFRFFFPIPMVVILFVCLIRTLRTRRRPIDFPEGRPMDNRLTAIATMLMSIYLVCTTPFFLLIVAEVYRFLGYSDGIWIITETVIAYACPLLSNLIIFNSSVNFLVYAVCLKEFRRILCKRCTAEDQRGDPTTFEMSWSKITLSLHWRHKERDGVSNHQPHDCSLNPLFRRRSKKTSNLRVTGLCGAHSPVTGEIPAQWASYEENVSIPWRYHGIWLHVTFLLWEDEQLTLNKLKDNDKTAPYTNDISIPGVRFTKVLFFNFSVKDILSFEHTLVISDEPRLNELHPW